MAGVLKTVAADAQLTVLVATTFWKDFPWGMR
jgi:hypothetical protein